MEGIILVWIMLWQMVITVIGVVAVMKIMLPKDPQERLQRPFREVDEGRNANHIQLQETEHLKCMRKRGKFPQMVYHTPLGDKYHLLPSCSTLEGSKVVKEKMLCTRCNFLSSSGAQDGSTDQRQRQTT